MKLECPDCGFVEPYENRERYVYSECGVDNIVLLDTPVLRCPRCNNFVGVSIWAATYLHSAIAWAISRKKTRSEQEETLLRKMRGEMLLVTETRNRWWYKRRGQLIELRRAA